MDSEELAAIYFDLRVATARTDRLSCWQSIFRRADRKPTSLIAWKPSTRFQKSQKLRKTAARHMLYGVSTVAQVTEDLHLKSVPMYVPSLPESDSDLPADLKAALRGLGSSPLPQSVPNDLLTELFARRLIEWRGSAVRFTEAGKRAFHALSDSPEIRESDSVVLFPPKAQS